MGFNFGAFAGAAAQSGVDTFLKLRQDKRIQEESDEKERQRQQRRALEEQSGALPSIDANVDVNTMPETQRKALGLPLSPAQQTNQVALPNQSAPAPAPMWQQNAQSAMPTPDATAPAPSTGMASIVADAKANGVLPTRAPNMHQVSQSDQLMMLADVYRRNGQPEKAIELSNQGKTMQANELGAAAARAGIEGWDALKAFTGKMNDGHDLSYTKIAGGPHDGDYLVQYGNGEPQRVHDAVHAGLLLSAAIKKDPQMIASLVHQYGTQDLENAKLDAQKNHWAAEEEVARSHVSIQAQLRDINRQLTAAQSRHLDAETARLNVERDRLTNNAALINGYTTLVGKDPLLYGKEQLNAASAAETSDPERLVKSNTIIDQTTGKPVSVTVGTLQEATKGRIADARAAFESNGFVQKGQIRIDPTNHAYGVVTKDGTVQLFDTMQNANAAATKIYGAAPTAAQPATGTGLPFTGRDLAKSGISMETVASKLTNAMVKDPNSEEVATLRSALVAMPGGADRWQQVVGDAAQQRNAGRETAAAARRAAARKIVESN